MSVARAFIVASFLGLATSLLAPLAQAQQVYRIVGPDGRVVFSDRPPPDAAGATAGSTASARPESPLGTLPFELRQVASRFPVTLYTSTECGPCASGKAMLATRGVPFTERTVTTPEDAEALKRLAGDNSLPLLTVGAQQLKGYSDTEWTQFLDAAGYPRSSRLPANFRNPPPAPLVSAQRAVTPAPLADAAPVEAPAVARRPTKPSPPPAPAVSPSNPAGIRF